MNQLTPYLFFSGRCAEALDYYSSIFEGEIISKQRFSEAPETIQGVEPDWIMHADFSCDYFKLMMSDGLKQSERDGPIALSVVMHNRSVQAQIFESLADGGKVIMPLTDTFWGAHFGQVVDRFGIRWMLHSQE